MLVEKESAVVPDGFETVDAEVCAAVVANDGGQPQEGGLPVVVVLKLAHGFVVLGFYLRNVRGFLKLLPGDFIV